MGRLKLLEIENFKSYAGKQVLGPFDDFTCVIGPNGSGKSNMMDAISFVLGIQSKHLRSTQLKDLVFQGDPKRNQVPRKAIVKLTYEPSDKELEILDEAVCFSRSITLSGVTNYQINNKDVTFEVYEKTLNSIGVLVQARNFLVFQGDIESIAQKSPVELTKLIEQISGSDALKSEYEELLKQKNEAEEAVLAAMQKKKLFVTQRKEAKEQKDEADDFLQKQEELSALKSNVTLWKIWKIKHQIEKYQSTSTKILGQLDEKSKQEEAHGRSIVDQKKELAKASKMLARSEKELEAKQTELDGSKSSSLETRAQIASLERRLRELEKSRDNVVQDSVAQKSRVALLKAELDTINGEEIRLKEALNSNDKTYKLDEEKIVEYSKLREEVAALTAADKTKSEVLSQEIKSIKLRISQLSRDEESMVREIAERKRVVTDYSSRLEGIKSGMDATVAEMKDVKAQQEKAVDSLNKIDRQVESAKQEYTEIVAELDDAKDDARRSKQELKEAEAIKTMQKIFVGVHGKLVDLCRPTQKKFAQAVVVASGKHMDAIVVDSKQVASECINYLKDQRIGTCAFLPLDNLKIKPIPERLRNLGQKYHLCVDLLDCEDIFKPAVSYAVGSTVVCDTLEDAQDLCFNKGEKVKVVTVKGHVIGKSGAMTGGTFGSRESANRWEEKDIERLQQRKHEIEDLLSKHSFVSERQLILNLDNSYHALQSKLQFSKVEFDTIKEKLNQASQHIQDQEAFLVSTRSQTAKLTDSCQLLQSDADEIQHNIEKVERQIFSKFSVSLGIQNIREHEEKHAESHQRIFSALKSLNERRTAISGNLEYEKKKKFVEMEQLYTRQIVEVQSSVATMQKKDSLRVEQEGIIVSEIMRISAVVNEFKTQLDLVSQVIRDLNKQHKESIKIKDSLISELSIEELGVEKLRAHLHEVLQTAQVDETVLPTTELDSSESSSSETSKSYWSNDLLKLEARSQSSSASNKMSNESSAQSAHFSQSQNFVVKSDALRACRVDLSSLPKVTNENDVDIKIAALEDNLASLLLEIQELQPNMHAVERYEGVMQRLQDTESDLEKLKKIARDVSTQYENIKNERMNLFQSCFQHVSEALCVIYRDLTKSTKHPLGGNAFLTIDNLEEPYLSGIRFTAMPPMKRFRDMDQLSGGEKTMAALALLFSLHSFRQAPFFVLDEIDAALDNVNVRKICNYVRQRSKEFQCIVISLKELFYENADSLVGVYKDVESLSTGFLTLDLGTYV